MRVLQDASVLGFDDIAIAAQASLPLSTIRQDLAGAARTLIDLLFKRIARDDTHSVVLDPRLVVRKSCGARVQDVEIRENSA